MLGRLPPHHRTPTGGPEVGAEAGVGAGIEGRLRCQQIAMTSCSLTQECRLLQPPSYSRLQRNSSIKYQLFPHQYHPHTLSPWCQLPPSTISSHQECHHLHTSSPQAYTPRHMLCPLKPSMTPSLSSTNTCRRRMNRGREEHGRAGPEHLGQGRPHTATTPEGGPPVGHGPGLGRGPPRGHAQGAG